MVNRFCLDQFRDDIHLLKHKIRFLAKKFDHKIFRFFFFIGCLFYFSLGVRTFYEYWLTDVILSHVMLLSHMNENIRFFGKVKILCYKLPFFLFCLICNHLQSRYHVSIRKRTSCKTWDIGRFSDSLKILLSRYKKKKSCFCRIRPLNLFLRLTDWNFLTSRTNRVQLPA